jgi:hypothetical protein
VSVLPPEPSETFLAKCRGWPEPELSVLRQQVPQPAQPKHTRWNKEHLLASRSVTEAKEERDNLLTFASFFSL